MAFGGHPMTNVAAVCAPAMAPAGYTTGAVVFDGATDLSNASLTSTDGHAISFSYWAYFSGFATDPTIWSSDPANVEPSNHNIDPTVRIVVALGTEALGTQFQITIDGSSLTTDTWTNILFSADTNQIAGSKVAKLYLNNVDTSFTTESDTNPAFDAEFNGLTFYIGNDTFGDFLNGYLADFWFAPGQSLLTAGDIAPATRAKFISGGKPVDLGADGSTPTGVAPAIFLHIPHGGTPANFATNLGTGGNFTIDGGPLTLAPSSPSD